MAVSRILFLLPFFILASMPLFAVAQDDDSDSEGGGMLANCETTDDCADGLLCSIYIPQNNNVRLCAQRGRCFCYDANTVIKCVRAVDECPEGYQCFAPRFLDFSICQVCEDNFFNTIDVNNNCPDAGIPSSTPSESPPRSPSPTSSISASPTVTPTPSVSPSASKSPVASLVDNLDPTPTEEDNGEDSSTSESPIISESPTPSLSVGASPPETPAASRSEGASPSTSSGDTEEEETEEPICVDARLLSHLSADDLVFPVHRRTSVLCDSFGSCATPGHVVVHNGRPMMMKSYCAIAGCTRTVKLVNSPRLHRGIRVPTLTKNLDFTALAARYESRAEETVLKALIHMGV